MDALSHSINPGDIRAWLILQQAPGIGCTRLRQLLHKFGTVNDIVSASVSQLTTVKGIGAKTAHAICHPELEQIERSLAWLQQNDHHFIPISCGDYPNQLAAIDDAPIALFVKGKKHSLSQPQIAIVGSRNPDRYGTEAAHNFAAALAQCGITVTSGLALGIDGAAHRGALNGAGDSIAVLATGLDYIYPRQHRDLAQQIAQQGCLVTEQSLGCPPKAALFPRRNRIISGLSLGCLVLQASLRSGSLITAHAALEQGREVFALPGSINNPLSKGCHQLIRQGAKLVETIDEILIELKEILSSYIANSNKFTLPQNNEIMSSTGANVVASVMLAQDHSFDREAFVDTEAFDSHRVTAIDHDKVVTGQHGSVDGGEQFDKNHDQCKRMLLQCLQFEPATIDVLIESCELSTDTVSSMLQELELQGEVSLHGGRYSRVQR